MTKIFKAAISLSLISCLTACYRMPSEGEYSTIPNTNNRDLTKEKSCSPISNAKY